jgi:uncharacterized protein YdhG (YjbR/CyaY superfamily)
MASGAKAVDTYLEGLTEPQASTLRSVRATLRDLLPDADEKLSYGVPAFLVGGKPVAGYAGFEAHCGYYPHSGSVLEQAADLLDAYDWSKGTLRFPIDEPLPPEIVERLVELRLRQLS